MEEETDLVETLTEKTTAISINGRSNGAAGGGSANGDQVVVERSLSSTTSSTSSNHKTVEIFKFEQHIDNKHVFQDFNDDDIDDEVFIDSEVVESSEEIVVNRLSEELPRPRERRVSDVIDCLGTPPSPSPFSKRHSFADFPLPLGSPLIRNVPIVMQPSKSDFNLKANGCSSNNTSPPNQRNNFIMDRNLNFCSPPSTPFSDGGYGSIGLPTPPSTLVNRQQTHFRYSTTSMEMVSTNDVVDAKPINEINPPTEQSSCIIEASMPVDADSEEYNMNHRRRGRAIIFNHDKFVMVNMPDRIGSANDVKKLDIVFTSLGFEVTIYDNLEWEKMKCILTELAQEDHSDADCLAVIVLTHGIGPTYLVSGDVPYPVDSLWTPFTADKCITLAGKPKLFFIQACRGDKLDKGMKLMSSHRTQTDSGRAGYKIPTCADFLLAFSTFEGMGTKHKRRPQTKSWKGGYKIPTCADFLLAFSTFQGFYSWRHPENGTWFIQSLCEELNEHGATMDLLKVLTRVSRRVAVHHQSYNDLQPWLDEQKQVPSINSMLIREVYFRKK